MVLGVVVAVDVALLFIVVMGADRGQWAGASCPLAQPRRVRAAPAASRSSGMPSQAVGGVMVIVDIVLMALVTPDRAVVGVEHLHPVPRRRLRAPPHPPSPTDQGEGCQPGRTRGPLTGRAGRGDIGMTIEAARIRPSRRGFLKGVGAAGRGAAGELGGTRHLGNGRFPRSSR